ncbi:MAG: hypothetical protein LPH21_12400 [Shewanella sp.]|nr:hypothetical protein [Shewanella sp.]
MKILFLVTCSSSISLYSDSSARYRCYNPADDLSSQGALADVCHVAQLSRKLIGLYDVFIFCRPLYEGACKKAINLLKAQGKTIVADYDDLLFGKENAVYSPRYINQKSSKRFIFSANKSYTRALDFFDGFIASTVPLANQIKKLKPEAECCVVHNGINKRWFDLATRVKLSEKSRIGYFAGGACHNSDFRSITPALLRFLAEKKHCGLLLPEALSVDESLAASARLERFEKKHFLQLPEIMADCTVNIAPLLDNKFNRCKSSIKFLESAAVGVPLIASPIPDFMRFSSRGLWFAENEQEWLEHLKTSINQSSEQRAVLCDELRSTVYSEGLSFPQSMKLLNFLQEVTR